jgi:phosphoglycolate phosphatase-like HAD superfamily hydrolase/8-oxo-dGTP pyrophosphatase MutT (NUDIX family)
MGRRYSVGMAEIRNVILDWSGTLVDDFGPVLEASNEIFKMHGKPVFSEDDFREKFYLPFTDFYKQYLPELELAELDHHYHTAFKILQTTIAPLPFALEFLDYLAERGMPTFLLSTIHREHFEAQGGRLKVKHYFKQAYVQALDKRKVILHLLAEHGLNADETIFIGDMVHDIETARHAGVLSCAVLTGYDSLQKLKGANPDLLFRNLREVRDFLDRHRGVAAHPPIPTVGALIFNTAGEVLMIQTHKWSHKWGIPGGKIKPLEASEDALHREVLEETGLKLSDVRFELVQDCIEPPEFYKKAHFLLLNYTATALGTDVVLNDEAETYRWLSCEEAAKLDLNGPTRVLLDYVRSHPRR